MLEIETKFKVLSIEDAPQQPQAQAQPQVQVAQ